MSRRRFLCRIALAFVGTAFALHSSATTVRSDASEIRTASFPSDRYSVPDPDQLTGLRVELPKPDCSVHLSDCEDLDLINLLDGFSVQLRIVIPFTGPIDLSTVTAQTVFLVSAKSSRTSPPRHIALNQLQWDPLSNTLMGTPDELLQQHRRYLLVVTSQLRDQGGAYIESSGFWAGQTNGNASAGATLR